MRVWEEVLSSSHITVPQAGEFSVPQHLLCPRPQPPQLNIQQASFGPLNPWDAEGGGWS